MALHGAVWLVFFACSSPSLVDGFGDITICFYVVFFVVRIRLMLKGTLCGRLWMD